jgi:hypothetical protein
MTIRVETKSPSASPAQVGHTTDSQHVLAKNLLIRAGQSSVAKSLSTDGVVRLKSGSGTGQNLSHDLAAVLGPNAAAILAQVKEHAETLAQKDPQQLGELEQRAKTLSTGDSHDQGQGAASSQLAGERACVVPQRESRQGRWQGERDASDGRAYVFTADNGEVKTASESAVKQALLATMLAGNPRAMRAASKLGFKWNEEEQDLETTSVPEDGEAAGQLGSQALATPANVALAGYVARMRPSRAGATASAMTSSAGGSTAGRLSGQGVNLSTGGTSGSTVSSDTLLSSSSSQIASDDSLIAMIQSGNMPIEDLVAYFMIEMEGKYEDDLRDKMDEAALADEQERQSSASSSTSSTGTTTSSSSSTTSESSTMLMQEVQVLTEKWKQMTELCSNLLKDLNDMAMTPIRNLR